MSLASVASAPSTDQCSLAVPRQGHVLTTVSEKYAKPIRTAVAVLEKEFRGQDPVAMSQFCLKRRFREPGAWVVRSEAEKLSWTLVSVWLTGFVTERIEAGAGIREAAAWFFDGLPESNPAVLVPSHIAHQADIALTECANAADYFELLPYVLDPHGPGSRLSVRRNAETSTAWIRKRLEGVYYTPADVAEFMLRECVRGLDDLRTLPTILDPACGTGVFLRAAHKMLKEIFPERTTQSICEKAIFGTDIDPWALDASAFVLLSDCLLDSVESALSPVILWHRLRLNLACVDALTLDPPLRANEEGTDSYSEIVASLTSGQLPLLGEAEQYDERVPLSHLFPTLRNVGLTLVGNPPYSTLGQRTDLTILNRRFASLGGKAGPTSECYPLFIEQMVRLAQAAPAAGTLVVPLSLASNIGTQYAETRSLIEKTPGSWRFAFFDREPHALFGEDVKTRNTILVWNRAKTDNEAQIHTGPLQKWRGNSRATMFSSIRFTPIAAPIRPGIPKIDGAYQARAFELLVKRRDRLDHAFTGIYRMPLAEIAEADDSTLFAGATAYNFLNVFLRPPADVLANAPALSEHPLHAMCFPSRRAALAAFAILSSHLAYWWWRANQDAFHVTRGFLAGLPFGKDAMSGAPRQMLAESGRKLWSHIHVSPVLSVNRGRVSLAYSPNGFDTVRSDIDKTLAQLAGLGPAIVDELQHFTVHSIRAEVRADLSTQRCERKNDRFN